jgi:hypothetical protein
MSGLRERPIVTFALCLSLSGALCLTGIFLLYKDVDQNALFSEIPLLAVLCVGLSLAITLFDAFKAAMLTLLLIVEYAALGFFSGHVTGDWEVRVFDLMVLQVGITQTRMLYPAAILIAVGAFILCKITVAALSRPDKKDPEILQAVSYADTMPRFPSSSNAEVPLSREEIEFLLGKKEHMAAKK